MKRTVDLSRARLATTTGALLVLTVGTTSMLTGCCKKKEEPKPKPTIIVTVPTSNNTVGNAPTIETPALDTAPQVADERSRPLNYIPPIPSGDSPPPTLAEWAKAQRINTQGPNSHPVGCFMKIKREWLKINCEGHYQRIAKMSKSFGMLGHDYYKSEKYDKYVDVIVRLRRGHAYKMRIVREDMPTASLFVNWPGGSKKPTIVALGKFFGDPDGPM